jgi:hypothetical protein
MLSDLSKGRALRGVSSKPWCCMSSDWTLHETSTHQDHVIAHVVGTTVLGYFEFDQSAHLLLDIGFIWMIFADGEMGLVPQTMAISELELNEDAKTALRTDAQALHEGGVDAQDLTCFTPAPHDCLITEVSFYARASDRRLVIQGEGASIEIVSSLLTGDVHVAPL